MASVDQILAFAPKDKITPFHMQEIEYASSELLKQLINEFDNRERDGHYEFESSMASSDCCCRGCWDDLEQV